MLKISSHTSSKATVHHVSTIDFSDFQPTVTASINMDITKEFSDTEIYDAICQIGDDKASEPDGLKARFYRTLLDPMSLKR